MQFADFGNLHERETPTRRNASKIGPLRGLKIGSTILVAGAEQHLGFADLP